MKTVIGLVGENGSGKGTFAEILARLLPGRRVAHIRFSHVLRDTLALWDIPATREHLQKLAVVMNTAYGPGSLTQAVEARISASDAEIVILDGVRWETDAAMIRRFPRNLLVYVTADIQTRYHRLLARKENAGEDRTTFEQFQREERAENELLIPGIGKTADVTIVNDGTMDALTNTAAAVIAQYIEPVRVQ